MKKMVFFVIVFISNLFGNDLLQLTLGVDRDSEKIANLSNHENVSYRRLISKAISDYQKNGIKVGFCGQQPSDSIEFCNFRS